MKVGTGESIVLGVKKVAVTPKFEVQQVDIILPTHYKTQSLCRTGNSLYFYVEVDIFRTLTDS